MRGKDRKVDLMRRVSLFSACSDRELRRIASLADTLEIEPGRLLAREGKPGLEFFVIADGNAKVTIGRKKVATLSSGDFFGEMALLDQGPRVASVTAETPMLVYVLDARSFVTMLEEVPTVSRKILRGIAHRLREVEKTPAKLASH